MKIIATHSFRGGSGKSFIALNMAAASAQAGLKTIIMDCDFGSPSFQSNLPPKAPPRKFGNDFLLNKSTSDKFITQTKIQNLDAIYANPRPILGQGLLEMTEKPHLKALQQYSLVRELLEKRGYKRLFLDTPPNLSYNSASALTIADTIILVHRPVIHSLDITLYVIQTIYSALKKSLKPREFFLIYNQVPHGTSEKVNELLNTLTSEFQKKVEIKVLGTISLDPKMDFWDSLIIREGSEVLTILKKMTKNIS
ncbi:MAG: ParA family protein [Candidatus Hodarchaeales archaeon]|jgi:MinD-like ATPase involved in chromosome partitioning or flagellar assembly